MNNSFATSLPKNISKGNAGEILNNTFVTPLPKKIPNGTIQSVECVTSNREVLGSNPRSVQMLFTHL